MGRITRKQIEQAIVRFGTMDLSRQDLRGLNLPADAANLTAANLEGQILSGTSMISCPGLPCCSANLNGANLASSAILVGTNLKDARLARGVTCVAPTWLVCQPEWAD